jgi:hypothetical protein
MPQIPLNVLNFTKGTEYCQFNYPTYLTDLKSCCGGNEVHVWQNCTHFCKVDAPVDRWKACVQRIIPPIEDGGYMCGHDKSATGNGERIKVSWMGGVVFALAVFAAFR